MMTALNIEEYARQGIGRVGNLFRRNRIRVMHSYCDSAALKSVCYEHYRGKIGWNAIDRFVKAQRNRVLCPPSLELPAESGYKRFVSHELNRRMCENAALWLLRTVSRGDIRTVLLDESGDSLGLCEYLVDHCDPVYVATNVPELYLSQAEYLLSEKGAAIRVCRSPDCLKDADLIIAPARLYRELDCSPSAVILSGERPAVRQNTPVIYEYFFDLPKKYQELKPPYLDDMYFASALYTMANARELGSELFTRCGDGCTVHTRMSLCELLKA